ncbi:adenine methyltransferase [Salipiger sp. IMCC34102]|uniref:DNA N-6-adenine-methyltransferase n=1 Tax=Salipiger sp. IMCC34102 TaxID=2510647 RepID=UPI00101CA6DF|nr:DNA N-6-adenine-methyltransferase [Salipiger sp. IMCC34102]RYH04096.1 adenine methyltransferase [Salipiger sp. IMCC34102]
MGQWEATIGASDEWYTPRHVFDAMAVRFDLDVASPCERLHVPTSCWLTKHDDGLKYAPFWHGFIWMNPPFGGRNSLAPWLEKFFDHGDGVALVPDRTSAPWFQPAAAKADAVLFVARKIRFIRPDGTEGASPANGTALMASGAAGVAALMNAQRSGLGICMGKLAA